MNVTEQKKAIKSHCQHTVEIKYTAKKYRELLWLQKLDKHERWVCGERVSSLNEKEYQDLLKH